MLRKFGKRAQTTAEYAILIALVVAAVTAMQMFVRRGLQGKIKDGVDVMGTKMNLPSYGSTQYEPYYLSSTQDTTQKSHNTDNMQKDGSIIRTPDATTTVSRTQDIGWDGAPQ